MKTLSVSELRANLMSAIEEIKKGRTITITWHGKTVAKLGPPVDQRKEARANLKRLRKTAIIGDLLSPIGEKWEANQ